MALKQFADTLREIPDSDVMTDCAEQLQKLLKACVTTKKGGKLVLTIDVKPVDKGGVSAVTLTPTVALKLPSEAHSGGFFFVTEDGNPSRQHPRQTEIPGLGAVESRKTEAA
jgi:hypothetical protein